LGWFARILVRGGFRPPGSCVPPESKKVDHGLLQEAQPRSMFGGTCGSFAREAGCPSIYLSQPRNRCLGFFVLVPPFSFLVPLGVLRGWRWTFWLILVAFVLDVLRVPTSVCRSTGLLRADGPAWYTLPQAFLGLSSSPSGWLRRAGYRRRGVWGSFRRGRSRASRFMSRTSTERFPSRLFGGYPEGGGAILRP
jgi:hypothetical protein